MIKITTDKVLDSTLYIIMRESTFVLYHFKRILFLTEYPFDASLIPMWSKLVSNP